MLPCISDNVLVSPHICCTCDQITHESLGVSLLSALAHLLTDGPSLWLLFVCFLLPPLCCCLQGPLPSNRHLKPPGQCVNPSDDVCGGFLETKHSYIAEVSGIGPLRKLSFMLLTAALAEVFIMQRH